MNDLNIWGITSSLPKVKAAARIWTGAFSISEKVERTNSLAGFGIDWFFSCFDSGSPSDNPEINEFIGSMFAPASAMLKRYNSKWLPYPPVGSESVSSSTTISLINLAAWEFFLGIQGVLTQVNSICNDFKIDMKSQTAKIWFSIKIFKSDIVLIDE